jgi:hypothetical protein
VSSNSGANYTPQDMYNKLRYKAVEYIDSAKPTANLLPRILQHGLGGRTPMQSSIQGDQIETGSRMRIVNPTAAYILFA